LRDVHRADDFVGHAIDLLLLVPRFVGIEIHVERCSQHFGRKLFGVVASDVVGLAKGMVLAQVAVGAAVRGNRKSNARRYQAMWLTG
jgi:hypothetical protein